MPTKPIRVLHVANAVDTTSVPADIATALARYTNIDVGILGWFGVDSFDNDELLTVHNINAPNTTLGVDRTSFRQLSDIISTYDIVQTHHNHSGTFAKPLARLQGKYTISTEQNVHKNFTRKGLFSNGVTNWIAHRVTCVSEPVRDSFKPWEWAFLDRENVLVINNPLDIERVERSRNLDWDLREVIDVSSDVPLVGTAGRLTEQKALDTLIQGLAASNSEAELVIAGDGELRESLESLAKREDVDNRVHFLGLIDRLEVYQLMDQVDIYAMPLRWEGFSAAAIEAVGTGTACLFSDIDEFTLPFGNVASFHTLDDHQDLAAQLTALIEDSEERKQLERLAREHAKEYAAETIANRYASIYRSLVG